MNTNRHCLKCNSPRKLDTCQKCGELTCLTPDDWEYPRLPPIDAIREIAKEAGYAIGVHGTLERDLDLIAAPWTEDAIGNHALIEHICIGLTARLGKRVMMLPGTLDRKPNGRYACNIQIDGWYKLIDLSIMPRLPEDKETM